MTLEQRLKEMEEKWAGRRAGSDVCALIKALRLAIEQRDYYDSFIGGRLNDYDNKDILKILKEG